MLECILQNMNFCDIKQLDKQRKFSKHHPVINESNKRFLKFSFNRENKSIDESMIPCYGTYDSRRRINKKPIRVANKIYFWWNAYLQLLVIIYLWITISHPFVCFSDLFTSLWVKSIWATVVLNSCALNHLGETAVKKERGHFKQHTSNKKSSETLTMVSSKSSEPKRFIRRWNKFERKYIQKQQPN